MGQKGLLTPLKPPRQPPMSRHRRRTSRTLPLTASSGYGLRTRSLSCCLKPQLPVDGQPGILLKNHFAGKSRFCSSVCFQPAGMAAKTVTHPSYAAAVSGNNFGMDHNDFFLFPEKTSISTVFGLLDTKSISWDAYQKQLPYAGYPGFNFSNQKTNDYMRKHNPPHHIRQRYQQNRTRVSRYDPL